MFNICVHVGATSELCHKSLKRQHSYDGQRTVLALYDYNRAECQVHVDFVLGLDFFCVCTML